MFMLKKAGDNLMDVKKRLIDLDRKQVDLIKPLRERGINAAYCEINLAINGRGTQEKHKKILETVNEILTEWEKKNEV